jgi:hypothetical protein
MKPASPPAFKSKLRPLSIAEAARMTAAQWQHRAGLEEREYRDWLEAQRRTALKPQPARRA